MNPALLGLVPIFKESIGKGLETAVGAGANLVTSYGRGVENIMTSYGRGVESIMGAVGDRIRGRGGPPLQ